LCINIGFLRLAGLAAVEPEPEGPLGPAEFDETALISAAIVPISEEIWNDEVF